MVFASVSFEYVKIKELWKIYLLQLFILISFSFYQDIDWINYSIAFIQGLLNGVFYAELFYKVHTNFSSKFSMGIISTFSSFHFIILLIFKGSLYLLLD